jgi:hypothetical protein
LTHVVDTASTHWLESAAGERDGGVAAGRGGATGAAGTTFSGATEGGATGGAATVLAGTGDAGPADGGGTGEAASGDASLARACSASRGVAAVDEEGRATSRPSR